jgi:hypothetical protein
MAARLISGISSLISSYLALIIDARGRNTAQFS